MTDMQTLAIRVAVLKRLAEKVEEVDSATRRDLLKLMDSGGIEKVAAALPDGEQVASVSVCGGGYRAVVVDAATWVAWVQEHHPDEIEVKVRDSFKEAFLDELTKNGEEVPGVELRPAARYVANFFRGTGRKDIERALSQGALTLPSLLAIEPGEASDDT